VSSRSGEASCELLYCTPFTAGRCFESGESPLTLAAQHGHEVIVESLLSAGADVNRLDANGRSAIHVAAQLNDLPTVKARYHSHPTPTRPDPTRLDSFEHKRPAETDWGALQQMVYHRKISNIDTL